MREIGLASNLPPKKPPISQKKVFLIQNLPPSDPSSHYLAHFCTSGAKKNTFAVQPPEALGWKVITTKTRPWGWGWKVAAAAAAACSTPWGWRPFGCRRVGKTPSSPNSEKPIMKLQENVQGPKNAAEKHISRRSEKSKEWERTVPAPQPQCDGGSAFPHLQRGGVRPCTLVSEPKQMGKKKGC